MPPPGATYGATRNRRSIARRWGLRPAALLAVIVAIFVFGVQQQSRVANAESGKKALTLLSDDSISSSGLLAKLSQAFRGRTGITVTVIAGGAGDIIKLANEGKGDAVLLNDFEGEARLIEGKAVIGRKDVMYTEMVMVGPKDDPAGVTGMTSIIDALRLIAKSNSTFVSRGDDSGINRAEQRLWAEAGAGPASGSNKWYVKAGAGMRTALTMAAERKAYTLTDLSTWLRFETRRDLVVVVEDDPRLQLRYGISLINPAKHPAAKRKAAAILVQWLISKNGGQKAIADFAIGDAHPFSPHVDLRSE